MAGSRWVAVKDHEFRKACAALGMREAAADPTLPDARRAQPAFSGDQY